MNNRLRSENLLASRTGSPGCYSPRALSPRLRSPHSPKGNLHRISRIRSPFQRIMSPQALGNSTLPSFLRITQPGADIVLNSMTLAKVRTADTTITDANAFNKYKKTSPISENISGKVDHPDDFINYVFDCNLAPDQILLRIGNIELSRRDLCCLRPGKLLPINLIDACLSCIKKKNKKLFQKKNTHDRVIIVKTSFAQKVLQSKEKTSIRSKKNILNFE